MGTVTPLKGAQPTVFTPCYCAKLSESNRALRQLRALGCKVVALRVADKPGAVTEIVVDRNPHRMIAHCPGVHVTFHPQGARP